MKPHNNFSIHSFTFTQKLHVFLFERILVLTRPATRGQQLRYQVYRQPIPVSEMMLDDLQDGETKRGSFRSTFSQTSSGRCTIRSNIHMYIRNTVWVKSVWVGVCVCVCVVLI